MKIKTKNCSYKEVMALPREKHLPPSRPAFFFSSLVRIIAGSTLRKIPFSFTKQDLGEAEREPSLILMNHSCFLDLMIAARLFYPRPYGIVCTSDGFVGKRWLMRRLGCISTPKFVSDLTLIRDMEYALKKKKISVLMYPEASYSFDGCATPLPRRMGMLFKHLKVPVVMVKTEGAFLYDPLYNGLQTRHVPVHADVSCLFTREQIEEMSTEELERKLDEAFTFDAFAWQKQNGIRITEPFRADGLERVLYKCPHCLCEGKTVGRGTELVCHACGKTYRLTETGEMEAEGGAPTEFAHIPDWFRWERESVRKELTDGSYLLDTDVTIGMMIDSKAIYMIGKGHLTHDRDGFLLTGGDGKLEYRQKPLSSYGLYSDYFWYEIGDMICIGNRECLYYCFPETPGVVAKTRLAAEELFKLSMAGVRHRSH